MSALTKFGKKKSKGKGSSRPLIRVNVSPRRRRRGWGRRRGGVVRIRSPFMDKVFGGLVLTIFALVLILIVVQMIRDVLR